MNQSNTMPNKSAGPWRSLTSEIIIEKERFHWVAIFGDGGILKQYGDDGIYHKFAEIDRDRLVEVHVYDGDRLATVIRGGKDVQLFMIYRDRRSIKIGSEIKDVGRFRFAIIGWKHKETDVVSMTYLMPDGVIISSCGDAKVE